MRIPEETSELLRSYKHEILYKLASKKKKKNSIEPFQSSSSWLFSFSLLSRPRQSVSFLLPFVFETRFAFRSFI